MRFEEHPTWQMLEEGKNYFKSLASAVNETEQPELFDISVVSFQSLFSLQLALEDQLILKGEADD
jgi:hypothetical protein